VKASDFNTLQQTDKLLAEHSMSVMAMNTVFDLFPADLRPDPNTPPPGRGGRSN